MKSIIDVIIELAERKGAEFVSLKYTATSGRTESETSVYNLGLRFNMERIYQKDLETLESKIQSLTGIERIACEEMIASIKESLAKGIGNNSGFTRKEYVARTGIQGLRKVFRKDGTETLEIIGFQLSKKIIVPGEFKVVKSQPKTLAKKQFRKELQTSKIRTLSLTPDKIHSYKANGKTIVIE